MNHVAPAAAVDGHFLSQKRGAIPDRAVTKFDAVDLLLGVVVEEVEAQPVARLFDDEVKAAVTGVLQQ